ncbi:hypothetical protein MJ699_12130 [Klebsiella pneumoniae]|nr:hypothetical protein MJ699_12130 [Klebsiella pneumoniae]
METPGAARGLYAKPLIKATLEQASKADVAIIGLRQYE